MSEDRRDPHRHGRLSLKRKLMIYGAVGVVHLALMLGAGLMVVEGDIVPEQTAVVVELIRPDPPEPKLDTAPVIERGGGKAAAVSTLRPVEPKTPQPVELVAPTVPTPDPPLVIGRAPEAAPNPRGGAGGEGDGTGTGIGQGDGAGRGQGPRFIRGPSQGELRALHPREAFRRRVGGRVTMSCRIRLDTRLEGCSVVSESPQGMGFGESALRAAQYFRFEPPIRGSQRMAGAEIQVGVEWP